MDDEPPVLREVLHHVDSEHAAADGLGCAGGELGHLGRHLARPRLAAGGHVGRKRPGAGLAVLGGDGPASDRDDAYVPGRAVDEALQVVHAVVRRVGQLAHLGDGVERVRVAQRHDAAPPAADDRLDDERKPLGGGALRGRLARKGKVRLGRRHAAPCQPERHEHLVAADGGRAQRVDHRKAHRLEGRRHVEAADVADAALKHGRPAAAAIAQPDVDRPAARRQADPLGIDDDGLVTLRARRVAQHLFLGAEAVVHDAYARRPYSPQSSPTFSAGLRERPPPPPSAGASS